MQICRYTYRGGVRVDFPCISLDHSSMTTHKREKVCLRFMCIFVRPLKVKKLPQKQWFSTIRLHPSCLIVPLRCFTGHTCLSLHLCLLHHGWFPPLTIKLNAFQNIVDDGDTFVFPSPYGCTDNRQLPPLSRAPLINRMHWEFKQQGFIHDDSSCLSHPILLLLPCSRSVCLPDNPTRSVSVRLWMYNTWDV